MVLQQKALRESVFRHLNNLRDVLADIDPAFLGTEMQDANEFLLRLLAKTKDEIDARQSFANPVRDNSDSQTIESYICITYHETVLKRQERISWLANVPRRQGSEAPTLQDALRLSMRPDRRELLCQHCHHGECLGPRHDKSQPVAQDVYLTTEPVRLPGRGAQEDPGQRGIPQFLSLDEHAADDVTRPPVWKRMKPSSCTLPDIEEPDRL